MAKLIKKKKKLRIEAVAVMALLCSLCLYFVSVTAVKSYNVILSAQAESVSGELSNQEEKVATLEAAVKELSDSKRIAQIAEEDGIKAIQSNVKLMDGE